MRILIPIGLLFVFLLFVVVVVIQSFFEVKEKKQNPGNSTSVGDELKLCMESAKIMPLPILNCMEGDCSDLKGTFQCQKMTMDNNDLIPSVTEEILCRNLTTVLSCDKSVPILNNNGDCNHQTEFRITNNICFTTRGIYHCDRNCRRVPAPSDLCHCLIS